MARGLVMQVELETEPHEPPAERAGAADALAALVERYQPRIARLAYRLLGWSGDVDDVVQEVFTAALRALPRFRGQAAIETWLYRITVNECRRVRRRSLLRLRFFRRVLAERHNPRPAAPPETALRERETFQRVRQAVQDLPPRYREVVVLHYLEGLAVAEIAAITGLSSGAVEVRLHRARQRLRSALADLLP